jgi:glyoxalase/bleomycin resistance protein/dioxygenase superfamily protein
VAETSVKPAVRLTTISPQFVVPDVIATAEYYRDVLGFRILGYFLDPPVFAMVARDTAEIHFGKAHDGAVPSPNSSRCGMGLDAYIWVNDLDPLHGELQARGAKIIEAPVLRVYKCYEMVVQDNFGFRLCFSMDFSLAADGAVQTTGRSK